MNLMFNTRRLISPTASAILALVTACIARAELTVVENADDQQGLTVFKMTVTPAAAPVPALKHRLTLRENELKPGDAATHYLRAFPEGGFENTWKNLAKEFGEEELNRWYSIDEEITSLPLDKLRIAAGRFDTLLRAYLTPASDRIDCNWGHGIITELRGPDIYAFLLPEIQSMRSIARTLMLCARVAVADRDYEGAINILRMNYRLGENVAKSPFLVSGLVGIAICGIGNTEMIELIAAPDSPNLYWAIAELPTPLVDLRTAVRHEFSFHTAVFPFMDQPQAANHTPEEWARLLTESLRFLEPLSGGGPKLNALEAQLGVTGLALIGYGGAKERLIESGMPAAKVDAMPVGQVIAIDSAHEFRRIGDELEKWWYVPFGQAKQYDEEMDELRSGGPLDGNFGRALARLLLPALHASHNAQMRVEWQLNAIQAIEAIRMHAAETGKLPTTLEEIVLVPVPVNPVTRQPYQYRLDGETAVLELPFSDGFPAFAWRFEIKLAK